MAAASILVEQLQEPLSYIPSAAESDNAGKKGVIPSNTEASTQWAVCIYNRSFVNASEAVLDDLLASHDPQLVCEWLCRFVMEACVGAFFRKLH